MVDITLVQTCNQWPTRAIVAANVRARLGWKRLSGQELARRIGLKQTTMSLKLRGVSDFTSDELDRLVVALELPDPSVLFVAPESFGEPYNQPAA